jgi:16S rRNA (cytosine967-C5)-methyltransferase
MVTWGVLRCRHCAPAAAALPEGALDWPARPCRASRCGRTPRIMEDIHRNLPLSRLLDLSADAVQAVREGRSLTDVLARCPADARPGVQALSFHTLRWLGSARALRALLAPKTPPPRVDALLCTALALLWPEGKPPYAEHTLVDQAVAAARQRTPAAAAFINAVLRRFLREREALVSAARRTPLGAYNHPAWWVERVRADWPEHWQAVLLAANQHPPMTLRVNARRGTGLAYLQRLAAAGRSATLLEEPVTAWAAVVLASRARWPMRHRGPPPRWPPRHRGPAPRWCSRSPARSSSCPDSPRARFRFRTRRPSAPWRCCWAGARRAAGRRRVLDACAAPGGKTAQLLEWPDLDVLALDADPLRLAARAGHAEPPAAARDAAGRRRARPGALVGWPTLRRHPAGRALQRQRASSGDTPTCDGFAGADDMQSLGQVAGRDAGGAVAPAGAGGPAALRDLLDLFKPRRRTARIDAFLQRHGVEANLLDPGSRPSAARPPQCRRSDLARRRWLLCGRAEPTGCAGSCPCGSGVGFCVSSGSTSVRCGVLGHNTASHRLCGLRTDR